MKLILTKQNFIHQNINISIPDLKLQHFKSNDTINTSNSIIYFDEITKISHTLK